MDAIDAAILAGGRGERLGGRAKALVTVGDRRIVERQIDALKKVAREVLLVVGDPSPYAGVEGVRVVLDHHPGLGPLAGLHAALWAASTEAVLVVGCDLPFLDEKLLQLVRDHTPDASAVVPRVDGRPQALHARYSRATRPLVEARLHAGELRLLSLVEALDPVYLDEDLLRAHASDGTLDGLMNVNTPADLARAEALARERSR